MRDLGKKANLDLSVVIVSLGLTYQMRIITLALTVFKNQLFKKKSHLNAQEANFTLPLSNVNLVSSFEQTL